jgi:hypothetical protein
MIRLPLLLSNVLFNFFRRNFVVPPFGVFLSDSTHFKKCFC